jgi:hypothetical protein
MRSRVRAVSRSTRRVMLFVAFAKASDALAAAGDGRDALAEGADSSAHGLALRELSRKSSSASETSDTRRAGVAWALLAAATALLARGIDEPAAKLLGAAEQILDETGAYIGPTERRLHEPLPAFIRDHGLDDARLSGYAMTLEEAVDLAVRSLD